MCRVVVARVTVTEELELHDACERRRGIGGRHDFAAELRIAHVSGSLVPNHELGILAAATRRLAGAIAWPGDMQG